MWGQFVHGLASAVAPYNLAMGALGAVVGTIVGIIPGGGPSPIMALILPFTFGMNPVSAIILLSGVYHGAKYGAVIPAILINAPGEPSAVVTTLDGHPMALQGKAGLALGLAAIASFVGGTTSTIGVMLLAPLAARLAVSFGPPEYVSLIVLALVVVGYLGQGSIWKALLSAGFGLLLGTVGTDPVTGTNRFTFGIPDVSGGVSFVVAAMGLFAIAEILVNVGRQEIVASIAVPFRDLWPKARDVYTKVLTFARAAVIGFFIGILPGSGATIASFISYGIERPLSPNRDNFGKGAPQGLIASETAINAASGSAMLPLLTLGLPSSPATAILLGAMVLYGLAPGPLLFQQHQHLVWTVIASLYVANVILVLLNWPLIPVFASIVRIRYKYLYPVVLAILAVASLSLRNNPADMWMMFGFGILGYFMRKFDFPAAPMLLALVLGPLLEASVTQSLIIAHGNALVFFERPISAAILALTFSPFIVSPIVSLWRRRGHASHGDRPVTR